MKKTPLYFNGLFPLTVSWLTNTNICVFMSKHSKHPKCLIPMNDNYKMTKHSKHTFGVQNRIVNKNEINLLKIVKKRKKRCCIKNTLLITICLILISGYANGMPRAHMPTVNFTVNICVISMVKIKPQFSCIREVI